MKYTSLSSWLRAVLRANWPTLIFIVLALAARSSLADHYVVPSGSMEPTLVPGDRVLVDKTAYGVRIPFSDWVVRPGDAPRPGDIAIFDSPDDGIRLIKRIVAVAGQTVELRDGLLRVDGRVLLVSENPLEERFADKLARLSLRYGGGPDVLGTRVPEGHVLVLGDSRGNSRDSRYFGFVAADTLYARALGVYYRSGEGLLWKPI